MFQMECLLLSLKVSFVQYVKVLLDRQINSECGTKLTSEQDENGEEEKWVK